MTSTIEAQLTQLIEHAIDGNAVLFVGSGFSRSARNLEGEQLKTGSELAESLGVACGLDQPAPLDDVADLYIEKQGATKLVSLLTRQFQVSALGPEHPTFGRIRWKRIYTTNYDNAIELAYKENSRPIVPISLEDSVRRVREESSQCVHINGYIDQLTEETLFQNFKLTDTSYSSSSFADSPWAGQFRLDVASARAVFFVGYSAYDLDVKRILLESPGNRRKTCFIVGKDPGELTRHKLSKFGNVHEENAASLAEKIAATLATFSPREHTTILGRSVVPFRAASESRKVRDRDVFDLFLWGKLDRDLAWQAVVGPSADPYLCVRPQVADCLQLLEDGERDIVVRSDLGNGKTTFLECLGATATQFGYDVFGLENPDPESVNELELVARCESKTLLLVDNYTARRAEIEILSNTRSDKLSVVFTARTLKHDVSFDWLHTILGVDAIPEIDLDRLSDKSVKWFSSTFDAYGLWGEKAGWSTSEKVRFLKNDCEAQISGILLEALKAPAMVERVTQVMEAVSSSSRAFAEAAASVLALSVIEIGTNLDLLSNLVDTEVLNQASFRNNSAIRELFDFDRNRIVARNAVVGRHILTSAIDSDVAVSALAAMATKADGLSGTDLYYAILRDLMRFSNVQSVLPAKHKMNAVLVYYERLKNLGACRRNPNFWLQYAIAVLALGRFDDARVKLDTAYAHAHDRPGYNTFMIDNTAARLELEQLIAAPSKDRNEVVAGFRRARTILNEQVSNLEYRHYPFRVATKYEPFLAVHRDVLEAGDREEIARGARFILRRIENLSAYRAEHRYVTECRSAMETILSENPIADT